jgi:hypothetical protein
MQIHPLRSSFCYLEFMKSIKFLAILCIAAYWPLAAQAPAGKTVNAEPTLPVINFRACPFEGCSFRKWVVLKGVTLYSTWKEDRKPLASLKPEEVVTGITGVHITYEPDRIQVLEPISELQLQPGDVILRYMYRGEGFADIWVKGQWHRQHDCSFITEKNNSGCLFDCAAKVVSEGRKDWWVQVKTAQGQTGWAKSDNQFDCTDSLAGNTKCDDLNALSGGPL